jgi:DNA helicase II / ATP-dependent DNA helicase PcrA
MNPEQRRAVMTRSGPLLVLAGAGTGKTRVITYRIAELIRRGTSPNRILAVTFTNKAAKEMKDRAVALLGKRGPKRHKPEISTFHSLCVRILRRNITRLGYPQTFSIYDGQEQESIARAVLRDLRVGHEKLRPGDLLGFIGRWKTHGTRPDEAEASGQGDKELLAALAYARYQSALRAAGAVDFDDLLLCTEQLFAGFEDARKAEASRFDHILVDEYQDTNATQYRIVKALAKDHRNLCVVGDDDQSIYAFRGAEVTHILGFERDWPKATVVRLEENYRCREAILVLANTLIAHNRTRHKKVLRASRPEGSPPRFLRFENESKEAASVAREIREKTRAENPERVGFGSIAVLFRTNEQPRSIETELRRERIPYVLIGGQSFFDRKEIRDVLAYLKVLANPSDEVSLLRILNTPRRGISDAVAETLLRRAVEAGTSLWDALAGAESDGDVPHQAGQRVRAFREFLERRRSEIPNGKFAELLKGLLAEIGYKSELERVYKTPGDIEARWETIGDLVSALGAYEERAKQPSLREFLDEMALVGQEEQEKEDQGARVALMTLHSAKGLEFPHVYMVGMEEGLLPHRRSIEDLGGAAIDEERRLCYVGVTRAKDELTLSFCKARTKWGVERPQVPSRFLMEMRGQTEQAARAAAAAEKIFRGDGADRNGVPAAARKPAGARKNGSPAADATSRPRAPAARRPAVRPTHRAK